MRPLEVSRRGALLTGAGALAATGAWAGEPVHDTAAQTALGPGARLGWAVLDLAYDKWTAVNRTLRLPMCSTFKWLLAACVLARVDAGRERLERPVPFGRSDLLDNAPVTAQALTEQGAQGARLSVGRLCEAAVTVSDNTAANLLLAQVGGPAGLTAWLRRIGDAVTRLDRTEPALNHGPVGEVRDSTTATAMVENLRRLLYGPVLSPASRQRLLGWMLNCRTGPDRLRAGLPPGWRIAHKTGTSVFGHVGPDGDGGAAADVGVLLPPHGRPLLAAVFVAGCRRPLADAERFIAGVAGLVIRDVLSIGDARSHG